MRVLGYIDAIEEERPNEETLAALQDADRIARIFRRKPTRVSTR